MSDSSSNVCMLSLCVRHRFMLEPLNCTHKTKKTMALTAAFGVKRLTCVHRPMPSSVCRAGSTAARTQWHAGMRNSCVFDTPVKSTRRDKVKAVLQRNVWEFFFFFFYLFLPTWAMSIQRWMILARTCGRICLCLSTVLTTQAATALNWVMVARMVGALSLFSFLSLWDQMEPRQWWGTTFLNSSCSTKENTSHR